MGKNCQLKEDSSNNALSKDGNVRNEADKKKTNPGMKVAIQ
jgi:hypothetical protein